MNAEQKMMNWGEMAFVIWVWCCAMLVLCAPFFLKTDITAKKDAIEETMSRGLASGPDA